MKHLKTDLKGTFVFLIFVMLAFFLSSCEKETEEETIITEINIIGVDWKLSHGRVYVDNLDTGEKTYFDHFSSTQFTSNLDIFGGSILPFDEIIQDVTSWQFGDNNFVLNGTKHYPYEIYQGAGTPDVYRVYGLENGSSRPITILQAEEDRLHVAVHEHYESNNNENYRYISTLTFVRAGTFCPTPCQLDVSEGYGYGGFLYPSQSNNVMEGTTWVITRYQKSFSTEYPNDTLRFAANTYTINGGSNRNYTLYGGFGTNQSTLTLYGCTTFGGDYSGFVQKHFIEDYEVNGAQFTELFNTNLNLLAWIKRIQ